MLNWIRSSAPAVLACGLFAFQPCFGRQFRSTVAPPTLKIRLLTGLSTYTAKKGTPFTAVAIAPYEVNGRVFIPRGSLICGTVRKVQRVRFGLVHERAALALDFDHYELPDGDKLPLNAQLASVDNARERVQPDGTIKGILAARTPNGLINGFWYRPDFSLFYRSLIGLTGATDQLASKFNMGPIGAAAFIALHCTLLRFPDPEIRLPPGTDMALNVTIDASQALSFMPEPLAAVPDALTDLVNRYPREITRTDLRPAQDIINLVFVCPRHELVQAFRDAGWFPSDRVTLRTFSRVYSSFSAMQTYRTAPVSKLWYRGRDPDFVFQKSFNTVSKRHHIRIWSAGTFDGQEIWLGAATHDTGVTFRPTAFEFQHKIDSDIDVERAKIVNDLLFAGCSSAVGYMQPSATSGGKEDSGIITDQRLAVLFLSPCTDDQRYSSPNGLKTPATWIVRLSRRLILESRNYIIREQPYYWGYQMLRWHRLPLSGPRPPANDPAAVSEMETAQGDTTPTNPSGSAHRMQRSIE
ncbi:MAG TPA: LssY C-terminal domain-containing protein [Bryobacteraceae bacterium]|jgi:hypothetical protein